MSARIAPFACFALLEDSFVVFHVASYVNDRDLADPEDGVVIVQAE